MGGKYHHFPSPKRLFFGVAPNSDIASCLKMAGVIAEDDGWKTKKSKQFLGAVLCVRFFEKSTTAFYLAYVLTSSSSLTDSTASPRYSCKD
jgi:hypothetical protein